MYCYMLNNKCKAKQTEQGNTDYRRSFVVLLIGLASPAG